MARKRLIDLATPKDIAEAKERRAQGYGRYSADGKKIEDSASSVNTERKRLIDLATPEDIAEAKERRAQGYGRYSADGKKIEGSASNVNYGNGKSKTASAAASKINQQTSKTTTKSKANSNNVQVSNTASQQNWGAGKSKVAAGNNAAVTPFVRKSDAEIEQLRERKRAVNDRINGLNSALMLHQTDGVIGMDSVIGDTESIRRELDLLKAEAAKLDDELRIYDYDKYLEAVNENTFGGRFKTNYTMGRITQDSGAAWGEYYENPTAENRQFAELLDAIEEEYALKNKGIVGEGGLIDDSLAAHLPQLIDRVKAVAPYVLGGVGTGAAIGAGVGAPFGGVGAVPGAIAVAVKGGSAGYVVGSAMHSFESMRGAEFGKYMAAGIDEETARVAANEAALAMAGVESVEAIVDVVAPGAGKAAGKAIVTSAIKEAIKKYAINVGSEAVEEMAQEIIGITALERAARGETGALELLGESAKKVFTLSKEELMQVLESGVEGAKIAVMLGGATSITTSAANAMSNRINQKADIERQEATGKTIVENGKVDAIIEEGLKTSAETASHKIAETIKTKKDAGEEVPDREIGILFEETKKTLLGGVARGESSQNTAKTADSEPVARQGVNLVENAFGAVEIRPQQATGVSPLVAKEGVSDAVKTYGKNGAKAFDAYFDNSSSIKDFNDAKAALERDTANQKVYYPNGKLVENEYSKKLWKGERDFLNVFSAITGTEIELVGENTIKVGENQYAYGSYSDGRIKSESTSETLRHITTAHEVQHSFQETAPKEYYFYRDYAVQIAESHNGSSKSVVEQYMERYGGTREGAMDEIAADFTQKLFKDRREMQKFIEDNMHDVKKRSMLEKFFDAVYAFIKKIETAFGRNREKMDAAALHEFGATVDELKTARQLWLDELKGAKKATDEARARTTEKNSVVEEANVDMKKDGEAIFSLKNKNININSKIPFVYVQNFIKVAKGDNNALQTLQTNAENALKQKAGEYENKATGYKATISKDTRQKILHPAPKFNPFNGNYTLNLNAAQYLDKLFENAVYVDFYAPQKGKQNNPNMKGYYHFVAPVEMDNKPYRALISARSKQNSDTLYVINVELLPMPIKTKGSQLYHNTKNAVFSKGTYVDVSIADLINGVNLYDYATQTTKTYNIQDVKFSLKDSKGRQLTEAQTEYFKNSKVRDADGNLLKMYHASNAVFTEFDKNKIGSSGAGAYLGYGFNFAASDMTASQYGENMMEVYLKIDKPLSDESKTFKPADVEKMLRAVDEANEEFRDDVSMSIAWDYSSRGYDIMSKDSPALKQQKYNRAVKEAAKGILEYAQNDADVYSTISTASTGEPASVIDAFSKLGYDGVLWHRDDGSIQYAITFDSNQAKDVTNENPTSNPDVRYSLKGKRKDGIEVYETSDEVMKLSVADRIKKYIDLMSDEYKDKTAKFVRNGHIYYAAFDKRDLGKAIYGDKRSSPMGKRALIRTGADGEILNLTQEATYTHSAKDTKNHKNTDYFDYFIKTVQIDGKVYDLLADVKKQYGKKEGYVYTVVLKDNKKIKPYPAAANKNVPVKDAEQGLNSNQNVSQNNGNVKNSLKGTENILKENVALKEYSDYLKSQMKLTKEIKVDKKALEKMVRSIIKEYDSQADSQAVFEKLDSLYKYMKNTEDIEWGKAKKDAFEIAESILNESMTVNDELYRQYKDLRRYLRSTRITISDTDKLSIADGYSNFRKANFGRINLVKDGTAVDVIYKELAKTYPEFFDESEISNPAEQLEHIAEVLDALRPYEENTYQYNIETAADFLALDIIEKFFELPQQKPTFADKQNQKNKDTKLAVTMHERTKAAKQLREQRERFKAELAVQRERIKELRENKNAEINEIKAHNKEKESKMSDKRKRSIMRNRIIRHINPMKEKLLKPSDKNHVPQAMRQTVAALLDAINLESNYTFDPESRSYKKNDAGLPAKRTQEFEKLRKMYQEIKGTDLDAEMNIDPSLLGESSDGIAGNFDKVISMRDVRLVDMTLEELNTVWDVLRAVEKSITDAGKMLSQQKYETTLAFAEAFKSDTESRKVKNSLTRKRFTLDFETPYTFFSHFGQAGKDFYRVLRNAQDKGQIILTELIGKAEDVVSSEQRKSLEKNLQKFTTSFGDELTLSKAHIMNIYLLSKRPQAEGHLLQGGIVQPEINGKIRRGTDAVKLSEQDAAELFGLLDAEEKEIADGMQRLTQFLAEKGNETTMQVYGYEKFTDPNYWPIKSAKEGVLQSVEEEKDFARSIRNIGAAKQTVPNASNPLEIKSVIEVFDAHASDMITYAAWLAPMEDANRLFNFRFRGDDGIITGKTMKGLLNRVGGVGSDKYWMNLMKDIQNGISAPSDDVLSGVSNKIIGNVRKAAIASNIRVIIQQPVAYLRAAVVLSPENMILGITKGATKGNGWEKALEYAPIAGIKDMGGFEVSANPAQVSDVLYSPETIKGKLGQFVKDLPTMGASKADAITWGAIWNASEWQIAKTRKDIKKGSEAFYNAVAELFTEVIDQTQVVDGVLQRSQIMRSSNMFNKQATAFMGEPTVSLNLLMRSYDEWRMETEPKKRSEALKKLGQAVFVVMLSGVTVAVAQSMVDALRNDDEDKNWYERFKEALTGVTGDEKTAFELAKNIVLGGNLANSMNIAAWIPYVNDAVSIMQGYTVERMDASAFGDLLTAANNVNKSFIGEGKWTKGYAVTKMITTAAKLFGSSAGNIMRDAESIIRSVLIEADDWKTLYEMEKQVYDVKNQKSRFMDILYQSLKSEDLDTYNEIMADLIDEGVEPSYIKSSMTSRIKKEKDIKTDVSSFDSTLAGIGLRYENPEKIEDDNSFSVDRLSGAEYVEYTKMQGEMLEDIINDFERNGFGRLDDETANSLLNAAYKYAGESALEAVSDGEYYIDTDWIRRAADGELGLSPSEYIILKDKYGASALKSKGIFKAYEVGLEPEYYLETKEKLLDIKEDYKDSKTEVRKREVREYLDTLWLTEAEYGVLMEAAEYKNPYE